MRISTQQIYQRGVDAILEQQSKLLKTQMQLATNLRFLSPADDPVAAAQVLGLSESISITEQYRSNSAAATARLNIEDSTLGGVANALQRARELAVRGNNGTMNVDERNAIALEVRQIIDEVQGLANTKDSSGEYIFGGYNSLAVPFSNNGAGSFSYAGDQGQRQLQISPTRQVAVSDSGLDVFMKIGNAAGTGYQDVFTTLYTLATDLEANAPNSNRITEIDNALDNILGTQARIGARLNTIDREEQVNAAYSLQLETSRSSIRDLDVAQAATDLSRQSAVLEAAQLSFIRIQGLSLFNYL